MPLFDGVIASGYPTAQAAQAVIDSDPTSSFWALLAATLDGDAQWQPDLISELIEEHKKHLLIMAIVRDTERDPALGAKYERALAILDERPRVRVIDKDADIPF